MVPWVRNYDYFRLIKVVKLLRGFDDNKGLSENPGKKPVWSYLLKGK